MSQPLKVISLTLALLTFPFALSADENANRHTEGSSHDSRRHAGEGEVDHSDPKNQRRMGIFHYNEGNRFLRKGDWREAERNYKMALHHDKTLYEVYVNLSTAYLQGKAYPEALRTLRELESMQPQNPMLHYNMACYHSLTGDTKSSLESLKKAAELGFKNKRQIENDPDLKNLRKNAEFLKWIERF